MELPFLAGTGEVWIKKIDEKLRSLVKVVSRGVTFAEYWSKRDGSVVEFERDALLVMGKWMKRYGEAIYNTTANPLIMLLSGGYYL